ncbi:MAG: ABC transporter ATP-binding protein [Dehalogenimonas sp.]
MASYTTFENIALWTGLVLFWIVAVIFILRYVRLKNAVNRHISPAEESMQKDNMSINTKMDAIAEPANGNAIEKTDNPQPTQKNLEAPNWTLKKASSPGAANAIVFDDVTKSFRLDERTTITPVCKVKLEIARGEFVVILGRSGTGKTTLLNLAAGLVKPSSGAVYLDGENLSEMNQEQLSEMRSRKLGFIFQFPSLIPALTIKDNISLPGMFGGDDGDGASERAGDLLKMLGLSEKTDVFPRQLSAGETKRIVVARSLINQPQLILADEPTSDLDSKTEQEVLHLLRDINATGVTFLIVTHSMQLVPFATRAFEMDHGELTEIDINKYSGAAAELA